MMKRKNLQIIFTTVILFLTISLSAQRSKMVVGKSNIRVEAHLSENETKEKAIELAKINALNNEFGQYVEQRTNMEVDNGKVNFRSFGDTRVNGEWLKTIGEPEFKYYIQKGNENPVKWISCKLKGLVRDATPKVNLDIEILSCPQTNCRTDKFYSEERMYMYVKSPVDGYISVFLDDGYTAYRLLPYKSMGNKKAVFIKGDVPYIFFSKKSNNFEEDADELELYTAEDYEINYLTVVFSEQEFNKPILDKESIDEKTDVHLYTLPKSISHKSFEYWLGENRAIYDDFVDLKRQIIIENK